MHRALGKRSPLQAAPLLLEDESHRLQQQGNKQGLLLSDSEIPDVNLLGKRPLEGPCEPSGGWAKHAAAPDEDHE